jgi:hypothetical protein
MRPALALLRHETIKRNPLTAHERKVARQRYASHALWMSRISEGFVFRIGQVSAGALRPRAFRRERELEGTS